MKAKDLRNSILQLAIQGKLVEQNPEDEPASVLLERIQAEKKQLIKEGKLKKQKALPSITEDEIPFDIPDNWEWVRLGEVFEFINGDRGKNYPSKSKLTKSGIPFISALNIQNGTITRENLLCVSQEQFDKLGSGKLILDDIVFCIRGSLGKCAIYQFENGAIASSLVILRRYSISYNLNYIFNYLSSGLLYSEINKYNNGTAQPNLSAANFKKFLLPLPPLAEQQRIVEKLEQIMSLIDEYEKLEEQLTKLEDEFPDKLKKSILQYAVHGKLLEQNPDDEPASVLLEKIQAEKKQLIKEGKIKKQKALPPITEDEKPFDIPVSWEWVRLGEVCQVNPRNKLDDNINVSFIPMALIEDGFSNNHDCEIRKWKEIKSGFTHFKEDDICIAKITPCFENRKSAILKNLSNGYGAGTTELHILRPYINEINKKYLLWFLKTEQFINDGTLTFTGTAGQQRISRDFVSNYLFPLPPIEAQRRIVDKVEELFALVDGIADEKALGSYVIKKISM